MKSVLMGFAACVAISAAPAFASDDPATAIAMVDKGIARVLDDHDDAIPSSSESGYRL